MRAAIYTRISNDREGRELGVTRQRDDCQTLAERLGATVYDLYEDNDIGASTRSRKPRPDYKRLLTDARAGAFDLVLAYTSSRLTRRPREHEDLIELAEQHGIRFAYVASPSFDLNTAAGRRVARILAANDAGEAEDISERVMRAARQRAEKGEWHGGSPTFGFEPVKEIVNGRERVADLRPHPVHAGWVREAIGRLLAGETLYGVCVDWNGQGRRTEWMQWKRTPTGGFEHDDTGRRLRGDDQSPWYPRTLKRVVTSPAVAGYREHDGQLHPAKWEPIVDRDDWERLRVLLSADERKASNWQMAGNGNARKYELSGLVFCGTCGHVMVSMSGRHRAEDDLRHSFVCMKMTRGSGAGKLRCGSMRIEMYHLEEYVREMLFAAADTPALRAAVEAESDDMDEAERALRTAIRGDEHALRRLADEKDDGLIAEQEYRRRRQRIADRLQQNESELARITHTRARIALPSGDELRRQWPDKDNVWRRTMLSAVIERIEISRHPAGVTTNLTRRRDESDAAFNLRREQHRALVMEQRVNVVWKV